MNSVQYAAFLLGSIALCGAMGVAGNSNRQPLQATPAAPVQPSDARRSAESPADRSPPACCDRDDDPLPAERTNCVRCHLTAGRELTTPVRDFARSAHDYAKMSCNDCHGGNIEDDGLAHQPEFDFIGTKLSAHMAACAECHVEQAKAFRGGPHYWDLSQRINRDYPICVDCHGNHDVGKPPADFALGDVCRDCHKTFDDVMPELAALVAENDRLWDVLRRVQAAHGSADRRVPAEFEREINELRRATARVMHAAGRIEPQRAESLNRRSGELRQRLKASLEPPRSEDTPARPPTGSQGE